MFPFSRQRREIGLLVAAAQRFDNVEDADTCRHLQTSISRHNKLCKRWRLQAAFNEHQMKEHLMSKLPVETVKEVAMLKWDHMCYDDFVLESKRMYT